MQQGHELSNQRDKGEGKREGRGKGEGGCLRLTREGTLIEEVPPLTNNIISRSTGTGIRGSTRGTWNTGDGRGEGITVTDGTIDQEGRIYHGSVRHDTCKGHTSSDMSDTRTGRERVVLCQRVTIAISAQHVEETNQVVVASAVTLENSSPERAANCSSKWLILGRLLHGAQSSCDTGRGGR